MTKMNLTNTEINKLAPDALSGCTMFQSASCFGSNMAAVALSHLGEEALPHGGSH
jgi:hypothetical protein